MNFLKHSSLNENRSAFLLSILLFILCLCIQASSTLLERFSINRETFRQVDKNNWTISLQDIQPGVYYVSAGRPRTPCDLKIGETIIDSTKVANSEVLEKLMLGKSFKITNPTNENIVISCDDITGFKSRLTHQPVIFPVAIGQIIQLWRTITELILGPTFSIILLMSILLNNRNNSLKTTENRYLFALSIIAFFYSLSLSYYTRMFFSGLNSTYIHVILRNLFSLIVIVVFGSYSKRLKFIEYISYGIITTVVFLYVFNPETISTFYTYQYAFFPISMALCSYQLFKTEARKDIVYSLRSISLVWLFVLLIDNIKVVSKFGFYLTPAILVCVTILLTIINWKEKLRSEKIELSTTRILSAIESKSPVREILTQLASIVSGDTHFSRVSAYIDGFILGFAEHPGVVYYRVMESGYQKNTMKDERIDFQEGRGTYMLEAVQKGEMLLRKSQRDNAWFIVIPLGKHACLNLSDTKPVSPYSAYESEELLKRLLPSLRTLNDKLIEHGTRQGFALEKLRSQKGDGKFDVEIGALFADINNYSTYTERYGSAFSDFVTAIYLPAMIKAVSKWAAPEFVRGDEIYFLSMKDLLTENINTSEAILNTAHDLDHFTYNEGASLCTQNGYEPLTLSVGVAHGPAVLICDPIKVRTSGQTVNEAKRLQESAAKGETLVHISLKPQTESKGFKFGEEFPVLVKKNFIMAVKLQKNSLKNAG